MLVEVKDKKGPSMFRCIRDKLQKAWSIHATERQAAGKYNKDALFVQMWNDVQITLSVKKVQYCMIPFI